MADRYRIEREVGRGGMATVYLAEDLKHHRRVAVKVLREELAAILGVERFLKEIALTAVLHHPHILPLFDSGAVEQRSDGGGSASLLYFIMPYVDGESLRDRLTREKQLPLTEVMQIATEIAGALDFAHQRGVLHRDIKPENVLLSAGGALLADLGIALALDTGGSDRLTETGTSLGTPAYMSPEQATGERGLDPRSDIFSLGVVVYEMLAGEAPYIGQTPKAVLAKVVLGQPTPLAVLRQGLPPQVDPAVRRALAKSPADRFSTPLDFVAALGRPAPVPWVRMPKVRLWGVAALLGALALLAGVRRFRPRSDTPVPVTTQITFTGNAFLPALSPDGSRIAYAAQQCDAEGQCSSSILISDTSGAVALPVVRGRLSIDDIEWTRDGRYLLFTDWGAREKGVFAVSTLGGAPRFLGGPNAGGMLAGRDTGMVVTINADSATWLRFVTLDDGVVQDSLMVPGRSLYVFGFGSPDGRRIGVVRVNLGWWTVQILDRKGRQIDSVSQQYGQYFTIRWAPAGDAILATNERPDGQGFDLLRFAVNLSGKIRREPDTLLRQLPLSYGHVNLNSHGLVYAAETREKIVYALTRDPGARLRFTSRRLSSSTGGLFGQVSPAGDWVLLKQSAGLGRPATISIMPFDSGPATLIGSPIEGLDDLAWAAGGRDIVLARRHGDRMTVKEVDPVSGSGRELGSFYAPPTTLPFYVTAVPQGGAVVSKGDSVGCHLHLIGLPGRSDTVLHTPGRSSCVLSVAPDSRIAALAVGDTALQLLGISLADGHAAPLSPDHPTLVTGIAIQWLGDSSIVALVGESEGMVGWYRLAAGGVHFERLGSLPPGTTYATVSNDGRKVVANVSEPRRDVALMRQFNALDQLRH